MAIGAPSQIGGRGERGKPEKPGAGSGTRPERPALREEVLLRIGMQHQILLASWAAFGVLLAAAILWEEPALLALYVLLATFSAASWQHSGARTVQLKTYLRDDLEPRLLRGSGAEGLGWEAALAAMRVQGLLGARWFVSTKGFFFASQTLATLGLVLHRWFGTPPSGWEGSTRMLALLLALAGQAMTIWILRYPQIERSGR